VLNALRVIKSVKLICVICAARSLLDTLETRVQSRSVNLVEGAHLECLEVDGRKY